jgi:translation elongation factor EF-1alpha
MAEGKTEIGKVTNFYSKISVAVVQLTAPINTGDKIMIKGDTTNFEQTVDSMQIEHKNIPRAEAGQSIGLKVNDRVRPGDIVYK